MELKDAGNGGNGLIIIVYGIHEMELKDTKLLQYR